MSLGSLVLWLAVFLNLGTAAVNYWVLRRHSRRYRQRRSAPTMLEQMGISERPGGVVPGEPVQLRAGAAVPIFVNGQPLTVMHIDAAENDTVTLSFRRPS